MTTAAAMLLGLVATMTQVPSPAYASPIGAPTAVQAGAGKRALVVSWTAPVSTSVNHYVATAGGQNCKTATLTCTISGLTAGTSYTASVIACPTIDDVTDCSAAATASAAIPGPPAVPAPPTVAYNTTPDQVTVSWLTPTSVGAGIDSYRVTPTPAPPVEATGTCTALVPATSQTPGTAVSCGFAGLTTDTAYTFKVIANGTTTNGLSSGSSVASSASASKMVGYPHQPLAPTVEWAAPTALTVSWLKPDGGPPIGSYTVTNLPAEGSSSSCGTDPNVLSCTFTGLTQTHSYTFRVAANGVGSSSGQSSFSPASAAMISGTAGVAGQPTADLGSVLGTATVSWSPPAMGGTPTSYTVTPSPAGPTSSGCGSDPSVLSCNFTGLTSGQAYTFTVTTTTAFNTGAASPPSDPVVSDVPAKPVTPTATLGDAPGKMTVTWPAATSGGTVTGYTVTPIPAGGGTLGTQVSGCAFNLSAPSCSFTGLDATKSYTFTVTARGDLGSTTSDPSNAVVPGAPGAPTAVTVTLGNIPGRATVSWTAPVGGAAIDHYSVVPSSSNGGAIPAMCSPTPPVVTCSYTTLDPTKLYAFTVSAVNAAGSAAAATTTEVVPSSPGAPTAVTVTLGGTPGNLTVGWSAPASGGAPTSYTVTASSSTGGTMPSVCTVTLPAALTCPFTGLNTAKPYAFVVSAINGSGHAEAAPTTEVVPNSPGAPTSVTVTLGGTPGNLTVGWSAPISGGSPASYTVTATSTSGGGVPSVCTVTVPATLTCSYNGLVLTRPYAFTVSAINPSGHAEAPATTEVLPDAPGAPTAVTAALGNTPGTMTVDWSAPVSGGAPASYTVTATSTSGGAVPSVCTVTMPAPLTCSYTNLLVKPYAFTVRAINPSGFTDAAATTELIPAAPGAPTAVSAALVAATPGAVTVTWSAPAGGGVPTSYTVTASSSNGGTLPSVCTVTLPGTLSCPFTGLTLAKLYAFTVSAINTSGHTEAAATTEIVPDRPGVPTAVSVSLGVSPGTATVNWSPPAGGGPVTGYTVTPNPSSVTPTSCTLGAAARSCDFSGLDQTTPYTFTVAAVGVEGSSTASVGPLVANRPGAPGIPTVSVTAPGVVSLTWTAPLTGGPVTDYTVAASDAPTSSVPCVHVAALTCIFGGLDPTVAYTFRVTANGDVGGTQSASSTPAVRAGPPSGPGVPTLTLAGPNAVRITWTAPASGGPVTNYSVTSVPAVTVPASCINVAALSCVFDSLASGTPYSFTVTANGPAGSSSPVGSVATVIPGPPDTPGKPIATLTGVSGQVMVSWLAPNPGAGISSYNVQNAAGAVVCTSNTTSCLVSGLVGSGYTFRVQAVGVTDSGNSAFSPLSDPITPGAVGAPATPTQPIAQAIGVAQISVSWTMPSGGPVTNYTVAAVPPLTGTAAGCTTTTITPCVFTGLDTGVAYQFQVTAHGPQGDTASGLSAAVTPATPRRPGVPTVTLTAPGTATVTWTAPVGGGQVTKYKLTSNQAATIPGSCGTDPTVRSCVVSDLNPAFAYTFQVEANGPLGESISSPSPALVPAAPGAPSAPTVVLTGVGQATVSWKAPLAGGPLTGYTLAANHAATIPNGCGALAAPTTCQVTGLDPSQSYAFTVAATGPLGPTVSDASIAVVPALPAAPGMPTVLNGGPGTATISWAAPTNGAGPILSYSVLANPSVTTPDSCLLKNVTSCVFTGLDPATPYVFTVRANGPFGYTDSASSLPIVATAPTAPGTPTVRVTAPGTVRVSWTSAPVGGGFRTGYTVSADPAVTSPCVNVDQLVCDFTGLDPNTSYTFLVTANGPAGKTPSVARSTSVIPGAPMAPGTPTALVTAPHLVSLTWTAAPFGAGPVTGYTVTSDPDVASPCVNVNRLTCDFPVDGPGPYTFAVTAVGNGGSTVSIGRSLPVTVAAPGAPGMANAVVTAAGSVRVTWPASVGGGPLAGYTVSSDPQVDAPVACVNTTALLCDFTGLGNREYTFLVTANGPAGSTPAQAPSAVVVPAGPSTVIAPAKPTVTPTDSATAVRVSWVAPNGGAGIASYAVVSNPDGFTCETPATSCVVPGLNATGSYTFQVRAIGTANAGPSGWSAPSEVFIPATLAAPSNVDVVGANHQIAVSWVKSVSVGVAGYLATTTPSGGSCTVAATESDCLISGLTNGTAYTVTVVAVAANTSLSSAPSVASNRVRPTAGVPGAPTAVRAVAGDGIATVSWVAPSWPGDGILSYTATAAGSPDGQFCVTSSTSCTIAGLTNANDYQITVVAIGRYASGTSAPSTPVVVQPRVNSVVPTSVTVTPGALNLTVQFAPGNSVANVASYTATAVGGPFSLTCTTPNASSTSCVITGVSAGTSYAVTVAANLTSGARSASSTPPKLVTGTIYGAPVLPMAVPTGTAIYGPLSSSVTGALPLGSSTVISGATFTAFSAITVGLYPSSGSGPVVLATAVADANGAFTVSVPITAIPVGSYTLVAAGSRAASAVRYRTLAVTVVGATS